MPSKGLNLTRLCTEEEENESSGEIRCNHGYVLSLLTAWTPQNPGIRYWVCPYYEGPRSCDFWVWKDSEIDPRSKFVIPKLLDKIGELENALEGFENLAKPRTTLKVENTIEGDKMKKIEAQLQDDMEKMKEKEKKWKSKLAKSKARENVLWFIILGMFIILVACRYPGMSLKEDTMRLPL
ncbi:hypothetical protein A4A49_42429 [Nicotiana attenuata]|uniref:GRF-type domain-containing protein n=1 Tax=Nicotiana attenuata TaxID=49451 RepID=A0A1J6JMF7_NICAT|nr:hypothetical protein A4A49_63053 [Nicotiana attenuata]OIT19213.1 hypothetical protein A4A49_42429 [Nicotiana attenuata]